MVGARRGDTTAGAWTALCVGTAVSVENAGVCVMVVMLRGDGARRVGHRSLSTEQAGLFWI